MPLWRSPDRLSRQDIGDDLAVLQDEDAVDEGVMEAVVERCDIVPGGVGLYGLGVEHRNVRVHADLQASLGFELGNVLAQRLGGNIGGVGERLHNIGVMGPGTGFGAACLVRTAHSCAVMSSEGGHISLAAVNQLDAQLIQELKKDHPHVSVETVFSGPGIAHLYKAMAAVNTHRTDRFSQTNFKLIDGADVSVHYLTTRFRS